MKTIKGFLLTIATLAAFTSCEKDGDLITLSSLDPSELITTETDVVLSQENSTSNVLSLAWSTSTLTVSNPEMSAPNVIETVLQVSTTEDFSENVVESTQGSLSVTYTGSELNTLAQTLGTTPGEATPFFFRLEGSTGANIAPKYSNIVSVNVTSYEIDMSVAYLLNSDQESTGIRLASPESDGVYTGFVGATGWYNFYVQEGDQTIWGNDGVSGTAFLLSSDADTQWNGWFPGVSGCYYVNFDTNAREWTALLLPAITVAGDLSGEMTFDRASQVWTMPITATETSMTIQLSGTGSQYNVNTSTDDALAVATPFAFASNGSTLSLVDTPSDITVTVPAAGDYTLTLDLNDPNAWTVEAGTGGEEPNEIVTTLYAPGIDDLNSGAWTFDNELALYDEENLAYAGIINVNSEWGYTINIERDNWDDDYTLDSGDGTSGTLLYQGENNIPAPTAGLYLVDVSLEGLTYNLTSIGNQIYLSGLNDVWDFNTTLDATGTVGEYSGQITITTASEWGFQIHLDDSWDHYLGGYEGGLNYRGSNITDDASLASGTYTMTVNLVEGTYTISE